PSPLEVLETSWVQYCVLLPREDDDATWTRFHPTNTAALSALLGDQDGTALVNEVGARPPGVQIMPLMSLAHETDLFADWARLIALDEWVPKPRRLAAGSAFFRGQ